MDIVLSNIATEVFRTVSPVRQIMQFASKDKLREMKISDDTFVSFGGGWVNHESPDAMRRLYIAFAEDEAKFHMGGAYSPTNGEPECKRALVEFESALFGMSGLRDLNIAIGQSSTQLTQLLLRILLNADDTICLLDPSYCNYPLQIHTAGAGRVVRFPVVDVQRFKYIGHEQATVARFRDFLLEHRPKVVLLVSPDNPTSQVLSQDFVASAYGAVKTYGGAVVMDFAYKTLVFGDTPEYFAWPPDGNFISMHSNSKWCHGLGRRLGWVEAPEYIVDAFESFQNSSVLCPDRMHQMVLAEYLFAATKDGSLRRYAAGVRERYAATAAATIDAVRCHLRLPHLVPQGGLYTCIQVDENGAAFVDRVLKNTGVLFIPGWGFGHSLNRAVRVSYGPHVNDHRMIDVGFRRVEEYLCHASSDHETG